MLSRSCTMLLGCPSMGTFVSPAERCHNENRSGRARENEFAPASCVISFAAAQHRISKAASTQQAACCRGTVSSYYVLRPKYGAQQTKSCSRQSSNRWTITCMYKALFACPKALDAHTHAHTWHIYKREIGHGRGVDGELDGIWRHRSALARKEAVGL